MRTENTVVTEQTTAPAPVVDNRTEAQRKADLVWNRAPQGYMNGARKTTKYGIIKLLPSCESKWESITINMGDRQNLLEFRQAAGSKRTFLAVKDKNVLIAQLITTTHDLVKLNKLLDGKKIQWSFVFPEEARAKRDEAVIAEIFE